MGRDRARPPVLDGMDLRLEAVQPPRPEGEPDRLEPRGHPGPGNGAATARGGSPGDHPREPVSDDAQRPQRRVGVRRSGGRPFSTGGRPSQKRTRRRSRYRPPRSTAAPTACAGGTCIDVETPLPENIEVRDSHSGLGHNPAVIIAVSDRLGQVGELAALPPAPWTGRLFPKPASWRPPSPSTCRRRLTRPPGSARGRGSTRQTIRCDQISAPMPAMSAMARAMPGEPGGDLVAVDVVADGPADLAVHRLELAGGLGGEVWPPLSDAIWAMAAGSDGHRDRLALDGRRCRRGAEGDGVDRGRRPAWPRRRPTSTVCAGDLVASADGRRAVAHQDDGRRRRLAVGAGRHGAMALRARSMASPVAVPPPAWRLLMAASTVLRSDGRRDQHAGGAGRTTPGRAGRRAGGR